MKTLKNTLIVFSLFLSNAVFGQHIDSLKIIPPNPSNTDIVKVVCYVEMRTTPCWLDTFAVTLSDSYEISIKAEYSSGLLGALCQSVDTISIGVLETGEYQLIFYVKDSWSMSQRADTASFSFTVSETSSVRDKNTAQKMSVYPNPATDELLISTKPEDVYKVEIYDVLGRKRYENSFAKNLSIDISAMPRGVYFVKSINTTNNTQIVTKIIIQ